MTTPAGPPLGRMGGAHCRVAFTSTDDLRADLMALGIEPSDGVFVHASLRALGPVVGGARVVVSALLDVAGHLAVRHSATSVCWNSSDAAE